MARAASRTEAKLTTGLPAGLLCLILVEHGQPETYSTTNLW